MKNIKYFENIALSNHDILRLLNNKCNIILYPDLYKYKDINEILNPYNCCIILYEARQNYGHWCALIKTNNESIEFFNPYGGFPDKSLDHISMKFRIKSNQFLPYLSMLMYKSTYNLYYNEYQFQIKDYDIKTCGRHCVVRALCKDLNIYEYKDLLDKLCKKMRTNYDGIVTILTI
jgi:hypothetical protein